VDIADDELVNRIRTGDKAAFRELARRHADRLFGLAYTLLGSVPDAEDAVQETLLAALNGIRGFEGRSSVGTWLRSILAFQASKMRRSRKVRTARSLDDASSVVIANDRELSEDGSASATDSRLDAITMLQTLPHEHREVLVLRELQQMSYEEIAQMLGVPLGTVESRLYRARQALRQRFRAYTV
jgi:RNA polymerase sigma-70 factor, ECF subfamily